MRSAFGLGLAVVLLTACGGGGTQLTVGSMPEGGSFTGVYFSPQYGEMHMVQNGNAVVGKYKKDERSGDIQGEVEGDVMRFEWVEYKAMVSNRPQESRGRGYFRYMVDPASGDHVIKGRWGLGDEDTTGGEWNAYKSKTREPDVEGFGGGESSGGESTDEGDSSEESTESRGEDGFEEGGEDEDEDDVF
jgi:hypothetical protein